MNDRNLKSVVGYVLRWVGVGISAFLFVHCLNHFEVPLFLPFVCLVPFFAAIESEQKKLQCFVGVVVFAVLSGFLILDGSQSFGWLFYIGGAMLFAPPYLCWGISTLLARGRRPQCSVFVEAALWGFWEAVFQHFAISASGFSAAMLSGYPELLQGLSYFGATGVSVIVVMVNILVARFGLRFLHPSTERPRMMTGLGVVLTILLVVLHGVLPRLQAQTFDEGKTLRWDIIQGAVTDAQYDAMEDFAARNDVFERYFALTKEAVHRGARLVIWPETAIRSYVGATTELRELFSDIRIPMLGGFPYILPGGQGAQLNSAMYLNERGELMDFYGKNFVIPISESEFSPGTQVKPIQTPNGLVATPICFEILFSQLVREMVAKGAAVIITLSNDAGFGKTSRVSAQVTKQAVLRAIENQRYVIRAAQSGVSSLISPSGEILKRTELFDYTILPAEFRMMGGQTFFVRNGDRWLLLLLLGILGESLLFSRLRNVRANPTQKSGKRKR